MRSAPLALVLLAAAATVGAFPLSEPVPGATPHGVYLAALASNGRDGLAVWTEETGRRLRCIRFDAAGTPLDASSRSLTAATSTAQLLDVATDGNDYVAVWSDGNVIRSVRVHNGVPADPRVVFGDRADRLDVVWGGSHYVLLYTRGTELHGAALDRNGALVTDKVVTTTASFFGDVAVTANAGTVLAFWSDRTDARVHSVDVSAPRLLAGTVAVAPTFPTAATDVPVAVYAASGGGSYMVAWQQPAVDAPATGNRLVIRALNAAGQPIGSQQELARGFFRGAQLVWNGRHFLLVYLQQRPEGGDNLIARRIEPDGIQFDPPIILGQGAPNRTLSSATVIGSNAVVGFVQTGPRRDSRALPGELYAQVINQTPAVSGDPAGTLLSLTRPDQRSRGVLWRGNDWLALWSDYRRTPRVMVGRYEADGTPLDGPGVILDPSAAEETKQIAPAMATSGGESLVVWTELAERTRVKGAIVGPGRAPIEPRVFTISEDVADSSELAVVWDGSRYIVAWQSAAKVIVATHVDGSGIRLDPVPVALTLPPLDSLGDHTPRLAARAGEIMLVWQRAQAWVPQVIITAPQLVVNELWMARFTRSLTPIGIARQLGGGTIAQQDVYGHAVAADPNSWLITWLTYPLDGSGTIDLYAARLAGDTPRPLLVASDTRFIGPTSVEWTGSAYVVCHSRFAYTVRTDGTVAARTEVLVPGVPHWLTAVTAGPAAPLALYDETDGELFVRSFAAAIMPVRRHAVR